ncbi:3-carboxy-cis,cis-muconate cycloisomerase [Mycobacterium kubicae]|uniref:3-carboxy-cis,cis-muconate cycloisomerase n=1 Tax=Mycobacterium kubicae TaxID=120959 RepID=A0AAX1JHG0_9MYCO|nr:lyase family protein [Mycobacterium kubicae]MCV7097167.1 3-carboxy-cis,cis-muconate cycloisomerase [Mycobacterium kubicae]ORW03119.1 3-carboxy-cis,cis-muconate cycloisomerase [Mycobacterium kubicae]QNI11568.1 3-carboxy-cis,cis-muconate cycloisomerase [Mycobacterium kubicae]QPI39788.1 3-carboxy-cis,cis-muconate cycloisomerase [Mycobacterium kubicae]GFG64423.1 3-carboxy-cis,cis-muconate cycloisomerase [Mycobacterium kubicae]
MTNLLWPGEHRAGEHMSDPAFLRSMVAVESAWLRALAGAGLAPPDCVGVDLSHLVGSVDCDVLAVPAEDGGNPVIGLVSLLRQRADPVIGPWIHRGLTSQDVVDTSLMVGLRGVVNEISGQLGEQISALSALVQTHRATPMVARTLTQHAAPTTFGAKAAGWLNGVVDAYHRLSELATPAQFGGAVGIWSATTELATLLTGSGDPAAVADHVVRSATTDLGLDFRLPWHTTRTPVTAVADALVDCTDCWGHIASDVVTSARPETGELDEPVSAHRGGSSAMPHKRNPVLSILIRRAAIAAPPLAATLHTAAALAHDERPDGAWHVEWETVRTLARRTVAAGSQCSELLSGLQIHTERMGENLAAADVRGEQRAIADLVEIAPSTTYFGAAERLVDESLQRAERALTRRPARRG